MTTDDRFISRNAAAALKGCTRKRIDTAIRRGDLPLFEVAGRPVVKAADVEALHLPVRSSVPPAGKITRTAAAAILGTYPQRVTHMIDRGELRAEVIDGVQLLDEATVRKMAKPRRISP
ncbi:DNA-binding protein [Mycolicibacterium mageritense]|uniref:DNA-binding protein n=1 Tax=Mycolicibacterium mageritense TaxID=53462 RepID=UPI0011D3C1DE|nr:DNA-binding protein [Mycolicibacterium mageritense]TXI62486.1 MAG: DNA-binding protein [Mycolicibacterium mageritense]